MSVAMIQAMARAIGAGVYFDQSDERIAYAVLEALVVKGYTAAPIEPTEAMIKAGAGHSMFALEDNARSNAADIYRAMIEAGRVK